MQEAAVTRAQFLACQSFFSAVRKNAIEIRSSFPLCPFSFGKLLWATHLSLELVCMPGAVCCIRENSSIFSSHGRLTPLVCTVHPTIFQSYSPSLNHDKTKWPRIDLRLLLQSFPVPSKKPPGSARTRRRSCIFHQSPYVVRTTGGPIVISWANNSSRKDGSLTGYLLLLLLPYLNHRFNSRGHLTAGD